MKSSTSGFALIFVLCLLPVVMAGFVFLFATWNFVSKDLEIKYLCRTLGLQGQQKVRPLLISLLALNNKARRLRAAHFKATQELAIALSTQNPVAIAAAQARLLRIYEQRQVLDQRQKQIIQHSDQILSLSHHQTKRELEKIGPKILTPFVQTHWSLLPQPAPRLAVVPLELGPAPTYQPKDDFENEQALVHNWRYRMQIAAPFSQFLTGHFIFTKTCAVSLVPQEATWKAQIIKGKSSLKSAW